MIDQKFLNYAKNSLKRGLEEYGSQGLHDFDRYGVEVILSMDRMVNAFLPLAQRAPLDAMDTLAELCHVIDGGRGVALSSAILCDFEESDPVSKDARFEMILSSKIPPRPVQQSSAVVDASTEDCKQFLVSQGQQAGLPVGGKWRRLSKIKAPDGWVRTFDHTDGTTAELLEPFGQGAAGLKIQSVVLPVPDTVSLAVASKKSRPR